MYRFLSNVSNAYNNKKVSFKIPLLMLKTKPSPQF
jgi:hypothetical protein